MVVLWAFLVIAAILLAAIAVAAGLAWAVGATTATIQYRRHRRRSPDFRQQGRDE